MDSRLEKRIEELQRDLDIYGQVVRQARARVAGEDEEWNKERDKLIETICDLVVAFKPDDQPSKAVHILGQINASAEKLRAPKRICVEFDNKSKLLHTLRDQQQRHENAVAGAREALKQNKWYANG